MSTPSVVVDTNILVAAGFNPQSSSARIIEGIRAGDLEMVWHEATQRESKAVVEQIPPLSWERFVDLFEDEGQYTGTIDPERIGYVPDPADRVFAALAEAVGAALITNDRDLLAHRDEADATIVTPEAFFRRT